MDGELIGKITVDHVIHSLLFLSRKIKFFSCAKTTRYHRETSLRELRRNYRGSSRYRINIQRGITIVFFLLIAESWVELVPDPPLAARITPYPFSITGEREYLRLLREAQRDSTHSSARHSLASSRRDTPRDR